MERKNLSSIIAQDFKRAKSSKPLKIVFFILLAFSFIAATTGLLNLSYQKTMSFVQRMRSTDVNVTATCVCLFIPFFISIITSKEDMVESPICYIVSKIIFAVAYVIIMYLFYVVINLLLHLIFVNATIDNSGTLNVSDITLEKSIGFACSNCLILCVLSVVLANVSIMLNNLVLSLVVIVPYSTFISSYLYSRIDIMASSRWVYQATLFGNVYDVWNKYGDTLQILTAIGVCLLYALVSTFLCILINKKREKRLITE